MRDRDRKREADRERRARIKAGTWDFPNGGAAELAKAGAAIHARLDRSSKSRNLPAKSNVFTPAPVPRPKSSAPRVIIPTSGLVASPAPARAPSASSGPPPSMVAIGGVPGPGLVDQGLGYPAPPDIAAVSTFTKWRENTETMLAAKADMQERRIAALEASQADRRAAALDVGRALAGLSSQIVQDGTDAPTVASRKTSTKKGKRFD